MKKPLLLLFAISITILAIGYWRWPSLVNLQTFIVKPKPTPIPTSVINYAYIDDANLQSFYQWTKEDPLFTSPDFDTKDLVPAIEGLEKENGAMMAFLKTSYPIFPINFLKDLIEVNRIHSDFLQNPSGEKAQDLIYAYQKTIQDNKSDLKGLLGAFDDPAVSIHLKDYFFNLAGMASSVQINKDALQKLDLNAQELEAEVGRRENCLKKGESCKTDIISSNKPEIKTDKKLFSEKDVIPLDVLISYKQKDVSLDGPYVVTTSCFGRDENLDPVAHLFYLFPENTRRNFFLGQQMQSFLSAKLADNNYYVKVDKSKFPENEAALIGDIPWQNIGESNFYNCSDSSFHNVLAAVDKFYRDYKDNLLFGSISNIKDLPQDVKEVIAEGSILEKNFYAAKFPSQIQAENLAIYYGYTYAKIKNWKDKFPNDSREAQLDSKQDEFLKRYLQYTRKLSNFHLLLGAVINEFIDHRVLQEITKPNDETVKLNYTYIYSVRSYFGLVYFPFSASFYRLNEPLVYFADNKIETSGSANFLTYQEAIKQYPLDEIKKWFVAKKKIDKQRYQEFKNGKQ